MNKRDTAISINPNVLKWAIESSGWDAKELSEKTSIDVALITKWQTHITPIKIKDLRTISKTIRRPLSIILLPEPPMEKVLTDYRKVGQNNKEKISKDTLAVIRNAKYIQSNAKDLLELRSEDVRPNIDNKTLDDDPDEVAIMERRMLGFDKMKRPPEESIDQFIQRVYLVMKDRIESLNILVMQASMPLNDARGFALVDEYPKVIMVNSKDTARPKLFTLLHEYAHILLKTDSSMCITNSENFKQTEGQNASIEKWCNTFAGAVIMPKEEFLKEFESRDGRDEPNKVIASMSTKFHTSKTAATVRILNLLDNDPRKEKYLEYYNTIASNPILKPRGGGGAKSRRNMAKECVNQNGKMYVRIVSDSKEKNLINTSDMIKYLSLKTKYFEELNSCI